MTSQTDSLITVMRTEIEKHGLELLQRYPNDLLVHDRAVLDWAAVPGMRIAWMVGHSHTHIVPLGLHDEETGMVSCLLNMGRDDRFYLIEVGPSGFVMKEVTRGAFEQLAKEQTRYAMAGSPEGFWLKRRDKSSVGTVEITRKGDWQNTVYRARISPVAGVAEIDKAALCVWCSHAIRKVAGTLFARSEITWAEPIRLAA